MLTMILINVDNLCWLLMFGGGHKEHENERWRGRREMNDEKKVKASGGGTQGIAYIF